MVKTMNNNELINLTNFICDLLCIENKPIIIIGKNKKCYDIFNNTIKNFTYLKDIKGKYFLNDNVLYLNNDLHNDDIVLSLIHELRHVYQFQEMNSNDPLENEQTVKIWNENLKNYLGTNDTDHKTYINQPLELDANAFTYFISVIVFGRAIFVNDVEKGVLSKEIDKIAAQFTIQEIKGVAIDNNLPLKIMRR